MVTTKVGTRKSDVMVELIRLSVVILMFGLGYTLSDRFIQIFSIDTDMESVRFMIAAIAVTVGYVVGGWFGRTVIRKVDTATDNLQNISSAQLVAGGIGGIIAAFIVGFVSLPFLFLPYHQFIIPAFVLMFTIFVYSGIRVGLSRADDFGRWIGVKGRLNVSSPSKGEGVKVVDTSALMDGRLRDVIAAGFLSGTFVIPEFVLHEMQQVADEKTAQRRALGQRGLDQLQMLQDDALVNVEVTEDRVPEYQEVDAKLAGLARKLQAQLLTGDGNLARVAEISGIRVLNLNTLAEAMKTPVSPGETIKLLIAKEGREKGQGVGYLEDGTMVVVNDAKPNIGETLEVDIISVMQSKQGRMLFANLT